MVLAILSYHLASQDPSYSVDESFSEIDRSEGGAFTPETVSRHEQVLCEFHLFVTWLLAGFVFRRLPIALADLR